MDAKTQSNYYLRNTGNYFDLVEGSDYHLQPLTFHEFLTKPESLFMYEDSFMQIPGYIQSGAQIEVIEEAARQYVVQYIMDEFEHNLLGMQDYVRWAKRFEHRCAEITPAFWAQVNMHDLMYAYELEMDQNTFTRTNTGNASRSGTQTTTSDQTSTSKTSGKTTSSQDMDNTQSTDSYNREGSANVVHASDQLSGSLDYDWSDGADSVREQRSRSGDTHQHMESETNSESTTESESHAETVSSSSNGSEENKTTGNEVQDVTNKQFMQEKQWAISTAQQLLPLVWLRQALRPMFYMLY